MSCVSLKSQSYSKDLRSIDPARAVEDAADVPSLIHQSVGKLYSQYIKKKEELFSLKSFWAAATSSWLALRYIITQESLGGEP